jgi:hypothetical protein
MAIVDAWLCLVELLDALGVAGYWANCVNRSPAPSRR